MTCEITREPNPKCKCSGGTITDAEKVSLPSGRMGEGNLMSGQIEFRNLFRCPDDQYFLLGHTNGEDEHGNPFEKDWLIDEGNNREEMIKKAEISLDLITLRPLLPHERIRGEIFKRLLFRH